MIGSRNFCAGLAASTAYVALIASPSAAQSKIFSVPAQPAVSAIPELARQADVQILVSERDARNKRTQPVFGTMRVEQAIDRMLRGTGLVIQSNDGRTLTLGKSGAPGESFDNRALGDARLAVFDQRPAAPVHAASTVPSEIEPASSIAPAGPAPAAATEPDEIVVTGSRLQVSGFSAPTPTSVLNQDVIDERAPTTIADVINRLPSVRLSSGPQQSQRLFGAGQGQSSIDLRALGSVRSLTLVDGNRFTPTAENNTIDSSIIPISLIERVDVVTGGASAAYGSDAVAGVVNYVLRKKMEGLRGSAQMGITQEGDGKERLFSLGFGTSFADGRGHLIVGGDYAKSDGVGNIYNRDWGRRQPFLVSNGTSRAAGVPAQSFDLDVTYSNQSIGGLINAGPLKGTAFGPGGVPFAFQYGQVLSTLMIGGTNDLGNPNANPPLLTPTSRRAVLARAEYEFSDNVTGYVEGNYGYTDADSVTGFYQGTAIIGINNPFLPAQTRADMQRLGLSTITVGRLVADYGGTGIRMTHRTLRGIAGLEGKLFSDFTWDTSVQYGETRNLYNINDMAIANWLAAVNAVTGPDGQPMCGPLATNPNFAGTNASRLPLVQSGCVPYNIFGYGSPSTSAIDYVTGHGGSRRVTTVSRLDAAANLRGSPFSTWAGPVQFAIGAEYRRDTLDAVADAIALQSGWNAANGGTFSGNVSVKEAYGEVGVPLAKDVPFARTLDLNAAVRGTDYSTSGTVVTWKVGGTWEPVAGLRFRATRSRDIRAPNLTDLYNRTGVGGAVNITNPFNGASGRLSVASTGNPNLTPEKADTTTVGVVLQPLAAKWLNASVDYYNIKIKDAITTVAGQDVITRCYQTNNPLYCSAITFDSSPFGIAYVSTQPFNATSLLARGIDFAVTTNFDLPGNVGKLSTRTLATYVIHLINADIERAGSLQSSGVPKWSGTMDVTYSKDAFKTTLGGRYFSGSKFDSTLVGPEDPGYNPASASSINTNRFPSAIYLDLYAEYTFNANGRTPITLFGSIQNLADKDPAIFAATNITSGGDPYDLIGRRFRVGVKFTHQ